MTAKEYARTMREECYRQNKDIMELTAELWLEIADNIENLANQAVEDYKNAVVNQLEEHKERIKNRKERDILNVVGKTNAKAAVEEDIEILKSAANATNGKNGG